MYPSSTINNGSIGSFFFREISQNDHHILGHFFENLSEATRKLYGPHPLTNNEANKICKYLPEDDKKRFIAIYKNRVIGYFLFDFTYYPNEYRRYSEFGINLDFSIDPVFAPCIADDMQGKGIASDVMPLLIEWAKSNQLRSIVLMGGTQEPNKRARAFYQNFGFEEKSWFYTENNGVNNVDMQLILKSE